MNVLKTVQNRNSHSHVNFVKRIRYHFITPSYWHWNLGIPSPERHEQRRLLDPASCTHNVPDAPTPIYPGKKLSSLLHCRLTFGHVSSCSLFH